MYYTRYVYIYKAYHNRVELQEWTPFLCILKGSNQKLILDEGKFFNNSKPVSNIDIITNSQVISNLVCMLDLKNPYLNEDNL